MPAGQKKHNWLWSEPLVGTRGLMDFKSVAAVGFARVKLSPSMSKSIIWIHCKGNELGRRAREGVSTVPEHKMPAGPAAVGDGPGDVMFGPADGVGQGQAVGQSGRDSGGIGAAGAVGGQTAHEGCAQE